MGGGGGNAATANRHSGRNTPQIRFADISPHINRSIKAEAIDRAWADSHAAGFAHPCDDRAGAGCKQNRVGERGGGLSPCCLCGGEARLPRRDVFLAEAFGGLRMRGPGRLDTGGGLIARSARGIDRLLTGGSRREQLALPVKITLRVLGEGQGLYDGLLPLRNHLRPQPSAPLVQVSLSGPFRADRERG